MFQIESEWFDQVKIAPGIRAKPNYVAGIRRDFRFDQYDIEQNLICLHTYISLVGVEAWSTAMLQARRAIHLPGTGG